MVMAKKGLFANDDGNDFCFVLYLFLHAEFLCICPFDRPTVTYNLQH
jgi:hypothetical protein